MYPPIEWFRWLIYVFLESGWRGWLKWKECWRWMISCYHTIWIWNDEEDYWYPHFFVISAFVVWFLQIIVHIPLEFYEMLAYTCTSLGILSANGVRDDDVAFYIAILVGFLVPAVYFFSMYIHLSVFIFCLICFSTFHSNRTCPTPSLSFPLFSNFFPSVSNCFVFDWVQIWFSWDTPVALVLWSFLSYLSDIGRIFFWFVRFNSIFVCVFIFLFSEGILKMDEKTFLDK